MARRGYHVKVKKGFRVKHGFHTKVRKGFHVKHRKPKKPLKPRKPKVARVAKPKKTAAKRTKTHQGKRAHHARFTTRLGPRHTSPQSQARKLARKAYVTRIGGRRVR